MLNPLILTGLTSKFPSLVLHMLIWHHKTLFGDIKVQVSKHEQAWARMLSPLILTGLTPKFPILVLHMLIWYRKTLFGDKVQVSTNEQAIFELKSALLSFESALNWLESGGLAIRIVHFAKSLFAREKIWFNKKWNTLQAFLWQPTALETPA